MCCTHSVVSALKLKEINPEMDVFIVYRDMRTFGLFEDLYREARSQGIAFIRYDESKELKVAKDQNDLQVLFTSYVLNREMEIRPDLLILGTAVVPPKENPIANLFKVPVNKDGFFVEAHVKLRPIDFSTDGVFLCGLAHSPKAMDESIAQGLGAAARAVTLLSQKEMFGNAIDIEPLLLGPRPVIGEVEAFLDEGVDIDHPMLTGAFARVQQHIFDDCIRALAVLNDLVEVVP